MDALYKELFEQIKARNLQTTAEVLKLRRELCRKYKPKIFPSIISILTHADKEQFDKLKFLITKPMRTNSGVTPIAIMSKPSNCPHGTCIMCPGGLGSIFGDVPQSYTGTEPSTMRSMRNFYDPYLTVFNRLEQYFLLNQSSEKIELIIQGGTFPAEPEDYQNQFIAYALKAMNDFDFTLEAFKEFFELPNEMNPERTKRIQEKILQRKGVANLKEEQKRNETAKIRCVGLTIETKPDWAKEEQANIMLEEGCTRVELGVQTTNNEVLQKTNRGHTVEDTKESFRILRDLGFKVHAHMMLGLPDDKNDLMSIFEEDFRPDMLKIYPCLVMPGTELEKMYKKGDFTPIRTEEVIKLLAEFKPKVPEYVRIMRIQRDIPTKQTIDGVDKTNLRQMLQEYMKKQNLSCSCIRCNEIKSPITNPELQVLEYTASQGKEFFISLKQGKEIIGFCRLRFPSQSLRKEITKDAAMIRELHVYGNAIDINKKGTIQHKGFGKTLLQKAEDICKENKKDKLLVISGIGVREYYKKLGYTQDGPYVSKKF
ncbi:tRNA uridine(34) 5-carboxymethylaminomethyl modification radical SAM/GNAT enzyme Elp3 [Candidatus Woesearchaeota archaeon]|nr:tRNA uridine(34) 5-carboxymethylaminomethyl modification radical SAM/GNAT enzyme Elp3 [Candidatus Woesearchaeota archaeon]